MVDVYYRPKCFRLLQCEGVVSSAGHKLPVFECDDCIVKHVILGPGAEEIELEEGAISQYLPGTKHTACLAPEKCRVDGGGCC